MANRPKQNRAEQDNPPDVTIQRPAQAGIHATVGTTLHPNARQEAQPGPQAGQNPRT